MAVVCILVPVGVVVEEPEREEAKEEVSAELVLLEAGAAALVSPWRRYLGAGPGRTQATPSPHSPLCVGHSPPSAADICRHTSEKHQILCLVSCNQKRQPKAE